MDSNILIVEDEFIIAQDISLSLENGGYKIMGIAGSVEEARVIMEKNIPGMVIVDIHLNGVLSGLELGAELDSKDIPFIYLSANSSMDILEKAKSTNPVGYMLKPYREKDLLVALEIGKYLHAQKINGRREAQTALETIIKNAVQRDATWEERLLSIGRAIQPHIPFDFLAVGMKNMGRVPYQGMSFLRVGFNEYQTIGTQQLMTITGVRPAELHKFQAPGPEDYVSKIYNMADFQQICSVNPSKKIVAKTFGMGSNLVLYVPVQGKDGFTFSFYSRKPDIYTKGHLEIIKKLERPMSLTFGAILPETSGGQRPAARREGSSVMAVSMVSDKPEYKGIVGSSHLLLTALDHLAMVAPSDTAVLILGETGTGKERFAKCLHEQSKRKAKPLIIVNCAALPNSLIESELFGHEKGAFTGAAERRIGKFEQAHGGTIFLDELGELPMELQAKLLRVLQEKEIERLGGMQTIKVDVRVIAATNNNLETAVSAGKFRLDLYYRLNVFPILLPPLRDRIGDLPILTEFFLRRFGSMAGKPGISVSDRAMEDLQGYLWPGNIRELENIIERHVLMCKDSEISRIMLPHHNENKESRDANRVKSIDENERDHILLILKKCGGRISGKGGAAELLDVPATTLNSKMKRLGIIRKNIN